MYTGMHLRNFFPIGLGPDSEMYWVKVRPNMHLCNLGVLLYFHDDMIVFHMMH